MKIGVLGLGHFASVVAHCLRLKGHDAWQFDDAPYLVREGQPDEGEIKEVIIRPGWHLHNCEVLWAAYDVPLNAEGRGQDARVIGRIAAMLTMFGSHHPLVLLSPQWRVGSTKELEIKFPDLTFAYVLENVRVGRAVRDFLGQQYQIVGLRTSRAYPALELLQAFGEIRVMEIESAEMTKHALNCQMALQIAWINEIARLCAAVGADAEDVANGLRLDPRVSPDAPLKPGAPFGGGSLKRDVLALMSLGPAGRMWMTETPIIDAILMSNEPRVSK